MPLDDIVDVSVEKESGRRQRGVDTPICERFLAGARIYDELVSELRRELRLPETSSSA